MSFARQGQEALKQQGSQAFSTAVADLFKRVHPHLDPASAPGAWRRAPGSAGLPGDAADGAHAGNVTRRHDNHIGAGRRERKSLVRAEAGRVVVVGLGPAGADLLLPAARAALERVPVRFVRTARHPAVVDLAREGIALEPLDLLYDSADDLDAVYTAIADRVVETAHEQGEIVYAVPGSPTVAERSVELVRAAGLDIELIPGISFVDLAWWRLDIDPMHGARVVDARSFAVDAAGASGPMLLAQCDSRLVCSEIKLALLDTLAPDHEVTVLQRLGLPDEHVFTVALADLDREVEPDHLTSLFVDTGDAAVGPSWRGCLRSPSGCAGRAAARGREADASLPAPSCARGGVRGGGGDRAAPARPPAGDIPAGAYDALEDELGDLLFQVMIQSVLASEAGAFTVADVARAVHAKLVRRHPHVFGDVQVNDASEVVTNWEQIKKTEKDDQSLVAGVTAGLPTLIAAQKLFRKGASVGLEPGLDLGMRCVALGGRAPRISKPALGALLAAAAAFGREHDVDAESALASWARRYKDRFRRMEQLAANSGVDLAAAPSERVRELWDARPPRSRFTGRRSPMTLAVVLIVIALVILVIILLTGRSRLVRTPGRCESRSEE